MEDRRAFREVAVCWLRLSDRVEEFRNYAENTRVLVEELQGRVPELA